MKKINKLKIGFIQHHFGVGKFQKQSGAGFTLIELIIAIGIMAVLTTVVLANYRSADRTRRIQLASDVVISALTDAQNDALTGKRATGCTGTNPYYLVFDTFASSITLACSPVAPIHTYTLPATTRIHSGGLTIDTGSGAAAVSEIYLYFYPPFGNVKACATSCSPTSTTSNFTNLNISLESTKSGTGTLNRNVSIDGLSGRISSTTSVSTASSVAPPNSYVAPTVTISAPANNATFNSVPASITISGTVNPDPGLSISSLDLYVNGISTHTITLSGTTYSYTWSASTIGTYNLVIRAVDTNGGSGQAGVSVNVTTAPPTVSLTLPTTLTYSSTNNTGVAVSLAATASQSGATISRVEFYQNGGLISTDTTSPYTASSNFVYQNGGYDLTARAYDSNNLTQTSNTIHITVNDTGAPTVGTLSMSPTTVTRPATVNTGSSTSTSDGGGSHLSSVELRRALGNGSNCKAANQSGCPAISSIVNTATPPSNSNGPWTITQMSNSLTTGLAAGTYFYAYRVVDGVGNATYSNWVAVTVN